MTPLEALLELLARVGASRDAAALVSEAELSLWPESAVEALKSENLLRRASTTTTVVCPGCEWQCTMPVNTVTDGRGKSASFVVCDKPVGINRVSVLEALLTQWRCGADAVGAFVAGSLGLRPGGHRKAGGGVWELGVLQGKRRSQMVCLRSGERLEVVAGESALPLAELVRFGADGFAVDREAIRQLVDAATTGDSRYTPSQARRESRKLKTKALHANWQRAYRVSKREHPEKSDKWHSDRIAKMGIKPERSAETIRKNMKR